MKSCLGVLFALVVLAATSLTLVYHWNSSKTLEFKKDEGSNRLSS